MLMFIKTSLICIFYLFFLTCHCLAGPQVEIQPSMTLSTTYDDNIFLNDDYKRSDMITALTPGFDIRIVTDNSRIQTSYAPSFVKFHKYPEYDNVRHDAQLNFQNRLTDRLKLNFQDSYLRTDEPLDDDFYEEDIVGQNVRKSRNTYERNTANISLDYQFGPRDHWIFGYKHSLLENEDPTEDNAVSHGPYTEYSYWFNVANGITLDYEYQDYNYSNEEESEAAEDDFYSHSSSITYTHKFSTQTSVNGQYGITTETNDHDSDDDCVIHDTSVGISHAFTPHLSISAGTGYYKEVNEGSDDEEGLSYNLGLNKKIERGNLSLRAERGWDQGYMEVDERDFTRYWSISGNANYSLLQHLDAYASLAYRENDEDNDADEDIYSGKCGLNWQFSQWYFLDLSYEYHQRQSQDPDDDYTDNRVMFQIGYSQPYRW